MDSIKKMLTTKEFYQYDFFSTLFPMDTSRYIIEKGGAHLDAYIQRCLSNKEEDKAYQFLAQERVYASKPHNHLRRTVKLDPVAEYFLYDIVFKNKDKFRKPFGKNKKHFGYRFQDGNPISAAASYTGFKQALVAYTQNYAYSLSFDVASYFNNIYHHDIVAWFANVGASNEHINAFGAYLRQINSGRSIDCWPQGMYPSKMVGNDFLRFIQQHHQIKAKAVVRFMDDFVLFGDTQEDLNKDFYLIQKLLGQKGLSVNPSKTSTAASGVKVEEKIDAVKINLLAKRRKAANLVYFDDFEEAIKEIQMTDEELDYLRELLKNPYLEEEDAELVLSLFREHPEEVQPHLEQFTISFPHLSKNIWSFCKHIDDKNFIGELVSNVAGNEALQEYQIFWLVWILQDFLMDTKYAPSIIGKLYNHWNATTISKAKVLEIPDNRFGLQEMRDEHLVAGRSDWLAWASAVGHRKLQPISRNHKLEYFANSSPMNFLIKSIVTE